MTMTIEEVIGLVRPNIAALEAYSTARDDCGDKRPEIFLDANERAPTTTGSTGIRILIRRL